MFTALQKSVVTDGGEEMATRKTQQAEVEGGGAVGGIAANRTMKDNSRNMRLQKAAQTHRYRLSLRFAFCSLF
jgi:hypothetical protein